MTYDAEVKSAIRGLLSSSGPQKAPEDLCLGSVSQNYQSQTSRGYAASQELPDRGFDTLSCKSHRGGGGKGTEELAAHVLPTVVEVLAMHQAAG